MDLIHNLYTTGWRVPNGSNEPKYTSDEPGIGGDGEENDDDDDDEEDDDDDDKEEEEEEEEEDGSNKDDDYKNDDDDDGGGDEDDNEYIHSDGFYQCSEAYTEVCLRLTHALFDSPLATCTLSMFITG